MASCRVENTRIFSQGDISSRLRTNLRTSNVRGIDGLTMRLIRRSWNEVVFKGKEFQQLDGVSHVLAGSNATSMGQSLVNIAKLVVVMCYGRWWSLASWFRNESWYLQCPVAEIRAIPTMLQIACEELQTRLGGK
ncbi:hypothetical protein SESBI_17812 [Sesbania bispinosa]|nr:hypothetical protein SESBI_17812 [Sesbania bispinosa]